MTMCWEMTYLVLAGRTARSVRQRDTVRRLQTPEAVSLHWALKALPYARRRHVDHLTGDEMRGRQLGPYWQDGVGRHLERPDLVLWRHARLCKVAQQRAGRRLGGPVGRAELQRVQRGRRGWWGVLHDLARVELIVRPIILPSRVPSGGSGRQAHDDNDNDNAKRAGGSDGSPGAQ